MLSDLIFPVTFDLFDVPQEAVKLKPSFPDAYLNLGNVYKVKWCAFCYEVK